MAFKARFPCNTVHRVHATNAHGDAEIARPDNAAPDQTDVFEHVSED